MGRRGKWLLLLLIIGTVIILTAIIIQRQKTTNDAAKSAFSKIPNDVVRLIEKYTYRENDKGVDINISGDRVVYRGKKMMGLRSNVVKGTFFETIKGVLRSQNALIEFSASDADWDLSSTSPLTLTRNVAVSFNNKQIDGVKQARIYFSQGILETTGSKKEVFRFR